MKTIGMIGGMSWESTVTYYQLINRGISERLGELHSARILLSSLDFAEIETLQHQGAWQALGEQLADHGKILEDGGADVIMICTNTMHKVADMVSDRVAIPLLHIADATGARLVKNGIDKVGLLGTRFTMSEDFYTSRLHTEFGIDTLVPDEDQQRFVHNVIYQQLCRGVIDPASRDGYLEIIDDLAEQGAQGVILGCTEIGLLVSQQDTDVTLFDTTAIHAQRAVEMALSER